MNPATPIDPPFPYFGGKRLAAGAVWRALGNPGHYVEPFCGSCSVLLARPGDPGVETVNDADGMIANVWRCLRDAPDETARHAAAPVVEAEYHARLALIQDRRADFVPWIEGDPDHSDPVIAGYWIYCQSLSIGSLFDSEGKWVRRGGLLVDSTKLPHVSDAGMGVRRALPHVSDAGMGVHRALPHVSGAGTGVHRELPHEAAVRAWFYRLAVRLERVRVLCGDWRRCVASPSALFAGQSSVGCFLDPPYAGKGEEIYSGRADGLSADAEEWAAEAGRDPRVRIVLCGYAGEHDALLRLGWTCERWARAGGYAHDGGRSGVAERDERLYLSPACAHQPDLFSALDTIALSQN